MYALMSGKGADWSNLAAGRLAHHLGRRRHGGERVMGEFIDDVLVAVDCTSGLADSGDLGLTEMSESSSVQRFYAIITANDQSAWNPPNDRVDIFGF